MATLEIRKISSKVWEHIPSDKEKFILGKWYVKTKGDYVQIVEFSGVPHASYLFSDVTVYDIGGQAETFLSAKAVMERLEGLKYLGFFQGGELDSQLDVSEIDFSGTPLATLPLNNLNDYILILQGGVFKKVLISDFQPEITTYSPKTEYFQYTTGNQEFTLSNTNEIQVGSPMVFIDNNILLNESSYTVVGNLLTILYPLDFESNIYIRYNEKD